MNSQTLFLKFDVDVGLVCFPRTENSVLPLALARIVKDGLNRFGFGASEI